MQLQLHKQARTTPAIRAELQAAPASVSTAALPYNTVCLGKLLIVGGMLPME